MDFAPQRALSPFPLPEVAANTVGILNHLSKPRAPFDAVAGGRVITLEFDPTNRPAPDWLAVPFTINGAGCRLHMPERLAAWSIAPLEAWPHEPDPRAFALLLEFAVLDLLTCVEEAGFGPVTLGTAARCTEPVMLGMRALASGEAMPLTFELPLALASSFIELADRLAPIGQSDPTELPLLLCIEAGRQELTPVEICSLGPGDVVMLDREEIQLALVGGQAAPLRRTGVGFVLEGNFASRLQRAPLAKGMNGMDALDDVALDALPLTVVLEFQRLTMTLGEVRALGPGSVLALPPNASTTASVDLVINGARIGEGELVRIGEGTGVRIVRLAGMDETARP